MRATLLPLVAGALGTLAVSCGPGNTPGGPLTSEGPFLSEARGNVRQVTLTAYRPPAGINETASCGVTALLFDAINQRSLNASATEGECKIYPRGTSLDLPTQSWVCAGAITASIGMMAETITLCPTMAIGTVGADGIVAPFRSCDSLNAGNGFHVSSMDELGSDDALKDLDATAPLPAPVTITAPITRAIGNWPASGDVEFRWTSANATSAIVRIEARDGADPAPYIVCLPRTNGQLTVPTALLQQSTLRTKDVRVIVASYGDTTVMAESAMRSYRVSAGFATSIILQR